MKNINEQFLDRITYHCSEYDLCDNKLCLYFTAPKEIIPEDIRTKSYGHASYAVLVLEVSGISLSSDKGTNSIKVDRIMNLENDDIKLLLKTIYSNNYEETTFLPKNEKILSKLCDAIAIYGGLHLHMERSGDYEEADKRLPTTYTELSKIERIDNYEYKET